MANSLQNRLLAELADPGARRAAIAHAEAYLAKVLERAVAPGPDALERLARFDEPLPARGADARAIVERLAADGAPATLAQLGGRFYGLVNGSTVPAAIAARWMADTWDQNAVFRQVAPLAAKLEDVAERWLVDLLKLPQGTRAGFVSGTTAANICGLAAARQHLLARQGWDVNARGLRGAPPIRVVAGRHAHASQLKALALLGFGIDTIEWIDVDGQGRAIADRVPALDPTCLLVLQAGNVNSGSFDPFAPLCRRAREAGAWAHIDGAFGLWAAASPKLAHLMAGAELADSWSADAHKTLNSPYDCGVVLCRHPQALASAMEASAAYLVPGKEREPSTYTPEMSRRARGVDVWATLLSLGREGVAELVELLHERARSFAAGFRAAGFDVLNDVVFNQVVVGCGDERDALVGAIQRSGECWVGGSSWFGRPVIRVSVCSWATTEQDVARSVAAFVAARNEIK